MWATGITVPVCGPQQNASQWSVFNALFTTNKTKLELTQV